MSGNGVHHVFDVDTRVKRIQDGEYAATISQRWNALPGKPNGGYLLALCLRALAADTPFPDPLVVSASFLRSPAPGPAEVRTERVRAGRSAATAEARLLQDGHEAVRLVATFSDLQGASGPSLVRGSAPELPAPERAEPLFDGGSKPGIALTEQIEYRAAEPPGFAGGSLSGEPRLEFWMRFKDGREPDPFALAMLVDAAVPAVLEIGHGGSATMQLTVHVRAHPAPGWLACRAETRFLIDGYHEEDFEIWDSAGRLVAQSRQLAMLRPRRDAAAEASIDR